MMIGYTPLRNDTVFAKALDLRDSTINPVPFRSVFAKPKSTVVRTLEVVSMLAPRKFMQRRKKIEVFRDAADEAEQRKWRRMMKEIEEVGSAVSVLSTKNQALPRDLVLGTLVRFKQLKKWSLVSEVWKIHSFF